MTKPTVFISYSHKDEYWKDRLVTHLGVPQKEDLFDMWDDRRISAGEDWYQEIQEAIIKSKIAIFLISADFLTSKFILNKEVPNFMERRAKEGVCIYPVIIRPCAWKNVKWLTQMNLRPKNGRPILGGNEFQIETDLAEIAEEIVRIIGFKNEDSIISDSEKESHNHSISTIISKGEKEKIEKKVDEHQTITLYDSDPSNNGYLFRELIEKSKTIDLYLYTAETFARQFEFQQVLMKHPGVKIRVLIRNPKCDDKKKLWAITCINSWKDEIYKMNRHCKVSIGLYKHVPIFRAFIFDGKEGFISIYKWNPNEFFEFMGVEGNKLLHITRDTEFGNWLLDLYQSRFEYEWQKSEKIIIPKALIFDMDGVIIDSMSYHAQAWKEAFKYIIDIEILDYDIYLREGEKPKYIIEDICKKRGIEISVENIEKIIEEKERIFNKIFVITLFSNAKEFLNELKKEGFLLGLVTGAPKRVMDMVLQNRLENLFEVTISGEMLKNGKPKPDPYLKALEYFKKFDINTEDCLVIENSPSGIKSAKAAGLKCIALTTSLSKESLKDADIIVNSLEDVKNHL